MPRTKAKPTPRPARSPTPNGPPAEVFTLAEAAAYLRLPEEELLRLVREQDLHARQVGTDWRFLKSAIDDWLRTGPLPESNKEVWRALAGTWEGDSLVEEELKETYRRRRQSAHGDGS